MTIQEEGKQIRSEVAKLRPDRHRRYSEGLQRRILDWAQRANEAGLADVECARAVGLKTWRLKTWRRREGLQVASEGESLALVQVELPVSIQADSALTLIAPSGHRVEGLAIEQVAFLLRELA